MSSSSFAKKNKKKTGIIVLVDHSFLGIEDAIDIGLVFALSLGMPLMMLTRNLAFTLNKDTSIAMLLYLEIVLAFLWEYLLLGGGIPTTFQILGSLLIIGGSCGSVIIKEYFSNDKSLLKLRSPSEEGVKRIPSFAEKFDPYNRFVLPTYDDGDDENNYDSDINDSFEDVRTHKRGDLGQHVTTTTTLGDNKTAEESFETIATTRTIHRSDDDDDEVGVQSRSPAASKHSNVFKDKDIGGLKAMRTPLLEEEDH
jgi:hypothetical protein